jgi:hypothetical protein
MSKHRNVFLQAVTSELEFAGIKFEITNGGKHGAVRFAVNGRRFKIAIPRSPKGGRANASEVYAQQQVRRLLRPSAASPRARSTT